MTHLRVAFLWALFEVTAAHPAEHSHHHHGHTQLEENRDHHHGKSDHIHGHLRKVLAEAHYEAHHHRDLSKHHHAHADQVRAPHTSSDKVMGYQHVKATAPPSQCGANLCDARWNLISNVRYESEWAVNWIGSMPRAFENKLDAYMDKLVGYLNGMSTCTDVVEHLTNYKDYKSSDESWTNGKTKPTAPSGTSTDSYAGRRAVEFFSLAHPQWRGFTELLFDGETKDGTTTKTTTCAWDPPAAGQTKGPTRLFVSGVKAKTAGFMWDNFKGRADFDTTDNAVKASNVDPMRMTLFGADATAIGNAAAVLALVKSAGAEGVDSTAAPCIASQAVCKWRLQFKSKRCGLYFWGDESYTKSNNKRVDCTNYFSNTISHGEGIHSRNPATTTDNPSRRMLEWGMPWIGGVSGSVVEFYALAAHVLENVADKDLTITSSGAKVGTFNEHTLAQLTLINVATLVVAGHHSLGELLFGVGSAERDRLKDKAAIEAPAKKQKFTQNAHGSKKWYFYSDKMKAIIAHMNKPTANYPSEAPTDETTRKSRYTEATAEFSGRSAQDQS